MRRPCVSTSRFFSIVLVGGAFILILCGIGNIQAQNIFGRISGTVTDPADAVVPNTKITITNEATKATRTAMTDSDGNYAADDLHAGIYSVMAERSGFKTVLRPGIGLTAGARLTVNLVLEVGAASEMVEVQGSGEAVNTTSGEISRNVDSLGVQKAALNQRNYAQLVSLIPGAALTSFDQTLQTTGLSTTASSVNGNRADGNLFTVDGGFNLDGGSNSTQLNNVALDFISEVAIKTSNFSAEYGRNNGASVNVVTRSGGNQFHGGVREYVRNNRFDAAPNGSPNAAHGLRTPLRFNDFGWNLGGPILHHKLFFFAGQEWKRIRQFAAPQVQTIPTTAELSGNFSASGVTLHAPANAPAGCTIVNNILSAQCITPDGKAIAAVYALAAKNASIFTNTDTSGNVTFQPNNPQNWREDIIRLDYQLGQKHSIYGRYIHDSLNLIDAFGTFTPGGLPTTPTNRIRPGYSYQAGDVWLVSPRIVNEAKLNVSFNRQRIPPSGTTWQRGTYGFAFTPPLGFVGTYPDGIPRVIFSNTGITAFPTAAPTQFSGPYFSLIAPTTDITATDNITWQLGSHSLKFGAQFVRNRKDQNSRPSSYNGQINFGTSGNPNTSGDPFADALLGNFQSFSQFSADPLGHFRFNDTEAYVNDNWKVNRKLSLEIGVRFVRTGPTYTQANNMANFDPGQYDSAQAPTVSSTGVVTGAFLVNGFVINGLVRPGAVPADQLGRVPGGDSPFVLAVPATAPRGFFKPESLLAPRLGFAFSPFGNDKTSIRGGVGIFYDKPEGNIIFGQPGILPFLKTVSYTNGNLSNIAGGTAGAATVNPTFSAVDPNFVVARTIQYSVGVQHQLPRGVLLDVAYVGNRAHNLVRQPNINAPDFATANLAANVGKTTNQLRSYLGYGDIIQFRSDASSNYNSLQVYAVKRKGDLSATVSYTYSRAFGNAQGINDNPEPECPFSCQLANGQVVNWQDYYYGPLSFDRRHSFVVTYTYDVPFFRKLKGAEGAILSGWELSGITRAQSGGPLTVTGSNTIGPAGTGVISYGRRASLGSGAACPVGKACYFDPSAYVLPPTTGAGNAPVGSIVGPGYYDWDFSLRKSFKLPGEGMSLALQMDAFNAFNRTNLGNPATAVGSSLGQITSVNPSRQLQFGVRFVF